MTDKIQLYRIAQQSLFTFHLCFNFYVMLSINSLQANVCVPLLDVLYTQGQQAPWGRSLIQKMGRDESGVG